MIAIRTILITSVAFDTCEFIDANAVDDGCFERGKTKPEVEQVRVELDMILQAVGAAAIAKRLVWSCLTRCQQCSLRRQIEDVFVPMKDRLIARQACEEGVSHPVGGEWHIEKTDLGDVMLLYRASKRIRQQLTAQADAQVGDILRDRGANQLFLRREVGVLFCLIDVLGSAQCDDGSVAVGRGDAFLLDIQRLADNAMFL